MAKVPNVLDKMSGRVTVPSYSFSDLRQSVGDLSRRGSPAGGPLKPAYLLKFVQGDGHAAFPHGQAHGAVSGGQSARVDSLVLQLLPAVYSGLEECRTSGLRCVWI